MKNSSGTETRKILIAGLGNILLGDEGIGVRIIELLEKKGKGNLPHHVTLLDGATAGYALIDCMKDFERVILIDAVRGGDRPGAVYLFGFDDIINKPELKLSGHQIDLPEVLLLAKQLGQLPEITLIGVEPGNLDYGMELSRNVKRAMKKVVAQINKLLHNEFHEPLSPHIPC